MSNAITIRKARAADQHALEELQRHASHAWEDQRALLLAYPETIELPLSQIDAGDVFVAMRAGRIAGFGVVLLRGDGNSELDGLFVEPALWHAGVGTRLIGEAERLAASQGARLLHVLANPRAKDFYLGCGFLPEGEERTRFGLAYAMGKPLIVAE